ncbi:MAG: TlpA disulfide reductase family protein [Armatimonadota bacterium]|nr:TlpA family protein disulfide reductase [bacterium]
MVKRRYASANIALVLLLALACAVNAQIETGSKAPDFSLPTLDGKMFTLSDCFKEEPSVVVLNIWATWCPRCKVEIPYLIDLQDKYKDNKDVRIAGVAIDQEKGKIADFAKKQGINYIVALDCGAEKTGSSYRVITIPTMYIIDKKGVVRYIHSSFPVRNADEQKKEVAKIENEIKTLLDEK